MACLVMVCLAVGFSMGREWDGWALRTEGKAPWDMQREDGLLDPQVILGAILGKEVMFEFPTSYEDEGELGDKVWDELMPLGSGFLRVPYPRKYAMPRSKRIEDDAEEAEIYSVSMTHQLHCLGVLRDVIIKYSKGDKSRFAGAGHEYHCLDYIRQAVLCAGDTTLDHAEIEYNPDGSELRYGFTGANATHRCRNWDAIKEILVEKRLDNKTGILF
ncbi:Oxidase ustYa [Lachnellula suecica]|uniref:Oxidase ustYa n=1 Tax=Lachnellula suecica TaxID=602035 RepID=A0A8T9C645_9HELO|nr:Oxidase ustYa [Lachnellula suecica]